MKLWKKLNKGLLLTVIVLIILVTYLVNLELQRKDEKTDIQKAVETYYDFANKYGLLPEENRKDNNKISSSDYDKYLDEVEKALKEISISNQEIINAQMRVLKSNMDTERESGTVIISMDRKILKVSKYSFDGEQVTVSVEGLVEKEVKHSSNNTTKKTSDKVTDVLILKKEDGKWKVVYANLSSNIFGASPYKVEM